MSNNKGVDAQIRDGLASVGINVSRSELDTLIGKYNKDHIPMGELKMRILRYPGDFHNFVRSQMG